MGLGRMTFRVTLGHTWGGHLGGTRGGFRGHLGGTWGGFRGHLGTLGGGHGVGLGAHSFFPNSKTLLWGL